jgi:hypothetical protein
MLRKILRKYIILRKTLLRQNAEVVYYNDPENRKRTFENIKNLRDPELLMSNSEAYQMYSIVESLKKVAGDMAEVGVYKGRSARLMVEASDRKKLVHLFDTFSGLPEPTQEDLKEHDLKAGEYFASKSEVEAYLGDIKEYVTLYEGIFPTTSGPVKDKTFSFVNIDVDLYQGTYDSLNFFYPRMSRGGVLMSHDYVMEGGVRDAIVEFFKDKPEPIFEVGSGSQAFIIKL